jgi:hypothetical protein
VAEGRRAGSDLPAEYVDPWRLLRSDLRAVLASLRLRLRELWRRNREADLWRPGFWPEALAAWFWPLLLILLLFLTLLPIGLALRQPPTPAPGRSLESGPSMAPPSTIPPPAIVSAEPDAPQPEPTQSRPSETFTRESPAARPVPPVPPKPRRDPLLMALEPDGTPLLLLKARPLPALALLQLTLAPEFACLPAGQRRQRALDWWVGARSLGYERLELRDRRDRLLARSALVGEGMVLFEGEGGEDS